MKYGLYAAVLASVVGGTVAWQNVDKSVHLVVDGQARTVHTTAGRIGDVLLAAGYHVGPHDLLAPSVDADVKDGARIIYQRGRLLHLDVNGLRRDIWTTAPTVADALAQLGYSTADFTSVSRAKRLSLSPTDLSLRTPRFVMVVHDGKVQTVTTTDATVAQLLADLDIRVGTKDTLSVAPESTIAAGQRIVVGRVSHSIVTATKVLPFATKKQVASTMSSGTTEVVSPGKDGLAKVTYNVVTVDGKVVGKTPVKTVVLQPAKTAVVKVGSANAAVSPAAAVKVSPGSAQDIGRQLAAKRGWGDDQFSCLLTLWNHESGWRVNASNSSGAYGIPQALPGSKMASIGSDWQTNATTQITWGLKYIASRYGTPCGAWSSWQAQGWY